MRMLEIREAPVPVGHDWFPFEAHNEPVFSDRHIAERLDSAANVKWHKDQGYLPLRVWLSNGQTIIVRAKP